MGLKTEQIENWLRHKLLGKKALRKSNKWMKNQTNRKIRRDKSEEVETYKKRFGHEF